MARGRMINQKIVEDIDFNEMSIEAQFLFMRTIPFLDRDGLVWGHPGLLASKIVPLLPDFYAKTGPAIEEWVKAGFVVRYMDGRTPVLFFKGFSKNQSLTHYDREGASSFAPPPGYYRTAKGLRPLDSDDGGTQAPPEKPKDSPPSDANNTPEQLRTDSGPSQDEIPVKGKERKGTITLPREDEPKESTQNSGGGSGELPLHRNRQADSDYARLCSKFESEGFGTLTQILGEQISAMLKEFPVDWIDDAMAVAVSAGKRQLRYVNGILVRWRSEGRQDKKAAASQATKILSLKEWCLKEYATDVIKHVSVGEAAARERYARYQQQQQSH
jgi:DnaD/phage-associated family protein